MTGRISKSKRIFLPSEEVTHYN